MCKFSFHFKGNGKHTLLHYKEEPAEFLRTGVFKMWDSGPLAVHKSFVIYLRNIRNITILICFAQKIF